MNFGQRVQNKYTFEQVEQIDMYMELGKKLLRGHLYSEQELVNIRAEMDKIMDDHNRKCNELGYTPTSEIDNICCICLKTLDFDDYKHIVGNRPDQVEKMKKVVLGYYLFHGFPKVTQNF